MGSTKMCLGFIHLFSGKYDLGGPRADKEKKEAGNPFVLTAIRTLCVCNGSVNGV